MQRSGSSKEFIVKRQGHIQNYVYKLEGLLAKESGTIESEESNRSGGFLQDLQDTKTDLENSPSHRGLSAKWPYLLLPLDRNRTVARGYSGGTGGWWRWRPGG
jgi:hypothetical protein